MAKISENTISFLENYVLKKLNIERVDDGTLNLVCAFIYTNYEAPFKIKELNGQELTDDEIKLYNLATTAVRELRRPR